MAIKLYNKTACADDILQLLITAAARRVGASTNVVVKVLGPTRSDYQGMAYSGQPCLWHLTRKRQAGANRRKTIASNGGWIKLHLPRRHPSDDHLVAAERFYELCLHEWHHIKEYQGRERLEYERKSRHDNRPQERRANAAVRRATDRPLSRTAEKAILALALWLEKKIQNSS